MTRDVNIMPIRRERPTEDTLLAASEPDAFNHVVYWMFWRGKYNKVWVFAERIRAAPTNESMLHAVLDASFMIDAVPRYMLPSILLTP